MKLKVSVIGLLLIMVLNGILCGEYFHSNGTTYYFSAPMKKNWFQAHRYCHANGMHLASIHTEEENRIIVDVIYGKFQPSNPQDHFWTSGTDMGQTDLEFYWLESGQAVLFTNWIETDPVANRNGCILLHGGSRKYKWHDSHCVDHWYFICQDRLYLRNTIERNMCANGTVCQKEEYGMHLASIHTEEENRIIIDVIYGKFQPTNPDDHFWTSGTDMGQTDLEFYWSESGHAVIFTNWIATHPVANRNGCILLHGGGQKYKWHDTGCTELRYFICQDQLFTPKASERAMCLNVTVLESG